MYDGDTNGDITNDDDGYFPYSYRVFFAVREIVHCRYRYV